MSNEAQDIIDKLRDPARKRQPGFPLDERAVVDLSIQAADLIEQQAQRIAELEAEKANPWRMIRDREPPAFTHIVMLRESGKRIVGQTDRDGWLSCGEDSNDPDIAWMPIPAFKEPNNG